MAGSGAFDRLQAAATRRAVLTGAGLAGASALAASIPLLRTTAQGQPSVKSAIDAAITLEAFAVTLLGVARDRGRRLALSPADVRFLRAAQCEDEAHYHFLQAAGAAASAGTFTIANATFENRVTFFRTLVRVEDIAVGAYMAAARQFAAQGELRLVEIAYQIGAVEAQHQALAKALLGDDLPNDRAFAQWRFRSPAGAVAALTDAGYIGGAGQGYAFPGPVDRYCRGVFGLVPETTEDQEQATPEASPVAVASRQ
jgi:hypothetical protein